MPIGSGKGALKLKGDDSLKKKRRKKTKELALTDDTTEADKPKVVVWLFFQHPCADCLC